MIAVTRIPTHRNDGSKVSAAERKRILKHVREKFRGYSLEGPFPGAWVASSGEVYEEPSYKLEVVISGREVKKVRAHFMDIGRQLGQRAIYFELREGGEIIDLEESEG